MNASTLINKLIFKPVTYNMRISSGQLKGLLKFLKQHRYIENKDFSLIQHDLGQTFTIHSHRMKSDPTVGKMMTSRELK